jgi:hypothetical protein
MLDLIKLPKAQIEKAWVELLQKNLNLSSSFVFHGSTFGSGSNSKVISQ